MFDHLSACGRLWFLFVVTIRTKTYPVDKRGAYFAGTDLVTALRIYGTATELPLIMEKAAVTLGRSGDLRVDHSYLAAVHVGLERVPGNWLRVENISADHKNPLVFEHREVTVCYLKPGDQFRIGDTVYYALNEEMRVTRRTVEQILGEARTSDIDDCLIAAAIDADRHIALIGEPGSDQERLGAAIHWASTRRRNAFKVVPSTRIPGSADRQLISDARDGTLLIWLPTKGKFDQDFISCVMAAPSKVRLIICAHSPGKIDASFPASITDGVARINIAPLRTRREEIAVLLDHLLFERRSSLRFKTLALRNQDKLLSHRWPRNLQELQIAADHMTRLSCYRSEREAERDNSTTRGESRAWRKRLGLVLPLVTTSNPA